METPVVLNSKGSPIVLNEQERHHVSYIAREMHNKFGTRLFRNSLGYEVAITTLTTIVKKISEQKFFEIAPADYIPVRVGEGTWSSNLTTYRSFEMADLFESGIVNLGGQNARLSSADAGVDALNIKIYNWAKAIGWSIFDLELASKSGNWDLVSAKEKSRKKSWDLGVQKIAFLGAAGQNSGSSATCLGLLNQSGITFNSTLITQTLASMSYTQLATFQQGIIQAYRVNCNYTAFPTHFIIPEQDYNGLVAQSSPQFPLKSTLQLLEEAFQVITRNKNFKILPLAYANYANGGGVLPAGVAGGANSGVYCLLNYDEESVRMDIPLDYTNTLANSIDNFSFQNVGYGQFTGVLAYRPQEMLYLGF
jgi:hypothetical protein